MIYKRITDLNEAKNHFFKSSNHIIFEMPNGIKIYESFEEVNGYYKDRYKELKIKRNEVKGNE